MAIAGICGICAHLGGASRVTASSASEVLHLLVPVMSLTWIRLGLMAKAATGRCWAEVAVGLQSQELGKYCRLVSPRSVMHESMMSEKQRREPEPWQNRDLP